MYFIWLKLWIVYACVLRFVLKAYQYQGKKKGGGVIVSIYNVIALEL